MDENPHLSGQMPQTIGRYQVQESIGFGAMGAVYKAFDPLIKRTLAIKTIRLDIPKNSPQYKSFIERFYHEARISGTLSHPNIVTLFDIGEEGGLPYLAMEFVEGETLSSLVERGVRFKPEKVVSLVSQIASAVDYAHSKGVIHRDIKPSNLILYEGDRVKVTDFGIAKLVDAEMTQSGTLLGTPSYMSPEQAMGDKLDGRSDIFSLGVCAFEMLAGEQPFPGNNVTSILYKLVHVEPIEPANLEMNGLVPEKWHQVFSKVLAKKPDDRYQTASEFVQDLEYCLGSWFGSAMGDDSEVPGSRGAALAAAAAEVTAAVDAAAKKAAVAGESISGSDMTRPMPAVKDPSPAKRTQGPPPAAAPASPPPAVPASTEGATIVMRAPVGGGAPQPARPAVAPAPAPLKRPAAIPVPAPPMAASEEMTIVMKPGQPLPASPAKSIVSAPAVKPAPKAAPAAPPPPATAASEDKTIVMKAGQPLPGPPPRPVASGAAVKPAPSAPGTRPPAPADTKPGAPATRPAPSVPPTAKGGASPSNPPPSGREEATIVMASSAEAMRVPETAQLPIMGRTRPQPPSGTRPPTPPTPVPPPAPAVSLPPPVAAPSSPETTAPVPIPEDTDTDGEEVIAQRKGPSLGLILGGVGLLLFLVVAIAGVLVYRKFAATPVPSPVPSPVAEATPAPTAPPLPSPSIEPVITTGSLHIDSQPKGATVKIDGEPRGVTPLDLPELPLGPHQVLVELRGHVPQTQAVDLTAEQPRSDLTITLSRTAPTQGVAEISSFPSGALVEIDGTPAGQTPLVEHRLKVGTHRVQITKEGFEPWSGTVAVSAGKRARLDASLKAIPRATPTPAPAVADPNRVYFEHEVDTVPKKVSGRSAEYPSGAPALKRGQRASVTVSFVVTDNGDVTDVQVMESGGSQLDEAVMSAFRTWKFTPGVKHGQKVKVKLSRRHTFLGG